MQLITKNFRRPVASKQNDIAEQLKALIRAKLDIWFQITPAMMHSIDRDGRLLAVSDLWIEKLGYCREEVIGQRSTDFLTPASRHYAVGTVIPEFFRTGFAENIEYQIVCKDGRILDVLISGVLDQNFLDERCASIAIMTDVTHLKRIEHQLEHSEERYRGLVENQSDLVSLAAPDGKFLFVNLAYARLHGLEPYEMTGRNLFEFVPQDAMPTIQNHLERVCHSTVTLTDENQVILPDGRQRWVAWTNRALRDPNGDVTAIHSVGRDIEDQKTADARLKLSEERYRILAEHSADMVFQLDLDLVRRYVSPACREILGYEPEELIGFRPGNLSHPEDRAHVEMVLNALLDGVETRHVFVTRMQHKNGQWVWVEAQFKMLKDPQTGAAAGAIGTLRDISARKAMEDQLAEANRQLGVLASQDALTGLSNRRALDETLNKEFRRAKRDRTPLSLLMIDVDWFKPYNDHYGHIAGDECLRRIAATIGAAIRRPADFAARYGGEEFVALLPNTNRQGALILAEKIRQSVYDLAIEHGESVKRRVTISTGVASTEDAQFLEEPASLLEQADISLYQAKRAGRNNIN